MLRLKFILGVMLSFFSLLSIGQACHDPLSIDVGTYFYGPDGACITDDRVRLRVAGTTNNNWSEVTWTFGDGDSETDYHSGGGAGDYPSIYHDYPVSGSYTVTAEITMNCDPDVIVTLTKTFHTQDVSDDATFTANLVEGTTYNFNYTGLGFYENGYGFSATIDFGDGSSEVLSRDLFIPGNYLISHEYLTSGDFDVVLSIDWNQHPGVLCSTSYTVSINIPPCDTCNSFALTAMKKYWVSAWVQEDHLEEVKTYDQANIELNFVADGGTTNLTFNPSGLIIDGWQRIVGSFVVPEDVYDMHVNLNAHSILTTYFDDIRIHPFNGSMKSYVYDGETFWLSSELDDNNYATFYEYDEEGGLVRIKKETARGIVTIQETRSNTKKVNNITTD